jgi:two-component system LytT family response regulator
MLEKLRTLIADDEVLARERLRNLLEAEPDIEIVGEFGNGRDAVVAIEELQPDLVFLDVQMPVLDGLDVVSTIGADHMPAVIFVTAYDRYALRAFEVHALDYLLKPFDRERFQKALSRAREHLLRDRSPGLSDQLVALLQDLQGARKPLDRLVIKSSGRVYFVKTEDIDWIEAAGNYARVHVGAESHLLRETMSALEAKLDSNRFVRIHRSTIVNLERIQELQPWFHGDYVVILQDGRQLTLSRGYRQKMQELFGNLF